MAFLELQDVSVSFSGFLAVDQVSLAVSEGETRVIIGPNGAGKTTLIEIMTGLRKPDSGTVHVLGEDIRKNAINAHMGVQIQENIVFKGLRVFEVMDLFCALHGYRVRPDDLLLKAGLEKKRRAYCDTLSGGQNQLLRLYLALAGDSPIIVLDEPTTGLDTFTRRLIWKAIQKIKEDGKTVFMSSHYMDEIKILSDRVILMENGVILDDGEPTAVVSKFLDVCDVRVVFNVNVVERDITRLPGYDFERSSLEPQNNREFMFRVRDKNSFLSAISDFTRRNTLNIIDMEFLLDADCKDGLRDSASGEDANVKGNHHA